MRRKIIHHAFRFLTALCTLASIGILGMLVWAIVARGWPAVSWHFFTEQIRLVGAAGGIFYNLVGTAIRLVTAILVSAPLATA